MKTDIGKWLAVLLIAAAIALVGYQHSVNDKLRSDLQLQNAGIASLSQQVRINYQEDRPETYLKGIIGEIDFWVNPDFPNWSQSEKREALINTRSLLFSDMELLIRWRMKGLVSGDDYTKVCQEITDAATAVGIDIEADAKEIFTKYNDEVRFVSSLYHYCSQQLPEQPVPKLS